MREASVAGRGRRGNRTASAIDLCHCQLLLRWRWQDEMLSWDRRQALDGKRWTASVGRQALTYCQEERTPISVASSGAFVMGGGQSGGRLARWAVGVGRTVAGRGATWPSGGWPSRLGVPERAAPVSAAAGGRCQRRDSFVRRRHALPHVEGRGHGSRLRSPEPVWWAADEVAVGWLRRRRAVGGWSPAGAPRGREEGGCQRKRGAFVQLIGRC